MENVLLAQEVMKDYDANRGKPRCALKLDIMKAFDSVRWDFIIHTLQVMGFPSLFLQWIEACLTSPAYSIKINGCSEGVFKGREASGREIHCLCICL